MLCFRARLCFKTDFHSISFPNSKYFELKNQLLKQEKCHPRGGAVSEKGQKSVTYFLNDPSALDCQCAWVPAFLVFRTPIQGEICFFLYQRACF